MQNNSGLLVLCGTCCLWPGVWAMAAWWLRGRYEGWAKGQGRKALWELWTH